MTFILGIETSCDETAASVVFNGREVVSSVIASQIKDHALFGGIVPEMASRCHLQNLTSVVNIALKKAKITLGDLSGIAVTQGPGLIGSLLVGLSFAKALAWSQNIPIVGVNHLEGHLSALTLSRRGLLKTPFIALLVSGGHTSLFFVDRFGEREEIGHTVDDAAGEAFDKVAKLYQLGYPGGVVVERLSKRGDPRAIKFPRPLFHEDTLNFSFSGLKTAVVYFKKSSKETSYAVEDICASFQEAVVDVLVKKTFLAIRKKKVVNLGLTGGVASNFRLRTLMSEKAKKENISFVMAPFEFCTDNAAMIAVAGYRLLKKRSLLSLDSDVFSRSFNNKK